MKLLIVLLLLPLGLIAQVNSSSRMQLGIHFTPQVNGLTTYKVDEASKLQLGFSGTTSLQFQLGKQFFIQTGIGFGIKNYSHNQSGLTFGGDINPQSGIRTGSMLSTNFKIAEFMIPIRFKYSFLNNRLFITSGFVFSHHVQLANKRTIVYAAESKNILAAAQEVRPQTNIFSTISLGFVQPIGKKIDFTIEPLFNYHFLSFIIPNTQMYDVGLRLGVTMDL